MSSPVAVASVSALCPCRGRGHLAQVIEHHLEDVAAQVLSAARRCARGAAQGPFSPRIMVQRMPTRVNIFDEWMKAPLLNPYGLKNSRLVTIDEVEQGLSCDCRCPACDARLIARKGKHNAPHFAHHEATDCNAAYETALHMIAKDILAREKRLWLPAYEAHSDESRKFTGKKLRIWNEQRRIVTPQLFTFDDARLETCLGDIVPDIILFKKTSQGEQRQLIVEICVTHAVDEAKVAKIRQLDVSAIEVKVPRFLSYYTHIAREIAIRELLLEEDLSTKPKAKWIYNRWAEPKAKELLRKFGVYYGTPETALDIAPMEIALDIAPMETQTETEAQPEMAEPRQLDLFQNKAST